MAETVNLPRDSTLRELVAVQKASIIASGNAAAIDRLYGSLVRAAKSVEEVNTLFVDWWNICWKEGVTTRNELCGRWFGTVLDDNRVHGTKEPLFATSQSAIGEATDDSVGLVCTPSTEAAANRDDFAKLPQFWALEVAAEKNADGTHTIYSVEFIDSYDDVRRSKHLCWVLQKNTYTKEWDEGGYQYAVSVGESGVKRVLLTAAQAANLFVGSSVIIGDKGTGTSTDRGVASMYKLAKNKRIASITDITIDGTAYKAVNIETDTAFDTEAGVTYISTICLAGCSIML